MSSEGTTLAASPGRSLAALFAQAKKSRQEGQPAQAESLFLEVLRQSPHCALAHLELGNLWKAQGRLGEALGHLRTAVRLAPREAAAWLNCGVAQLELGARDEAVECFREALVLEPGRPEAHNILAHALLLRGKSELAARHLTEALRIRPGYGAAHDNLGRVLKLQGRAAEALDHHRAALVAAPKASTHSNLLYTLNLLNLPPDQIFAEHLRWAEIYGTARNARSVPLHDPSSRLDRMAQSPADHRPPIQPHPVACVAERSERFVAGPRTGPRIRIGYVSPDLCAHAVSFFFEPVLENHDRSQFEVFCYSDVLVPDAVTARLRSRAEHWRDTSKLGDSSLFEAIRADGIDVLVDLAGHTAGNRLAVFARRAAPAQFTWLGYPNTTGLSAMDFRVTDELADPAGTDRWHSETLIRLPGPFACFRPAEDSPRVAPPPSLAADGVITFGCFNHIAKLNEPLFHLWAAVLRAVPRSRLLLKSRGMGDAGTVRSVRKQFALAGVAEERIEFLSAELSVFEHLALYARVDIALDAFPYAGATTTCEALWMGVPVVTLAGQTHVSRVGASLLTAAGCNEGIASCCDDYVRIATEHARSMDTLAVRRETQRERMAASPLCRGADFTRHLESAFRLGLGEKVAGGRPAQLVA